MDYSKNELWKDISGKTGYQVSNLGRVRSVDREIPAKNGGLRFYKGKILRTSLDTRGYPTAQFQHNSKHSSRLVHRLVAEAFIPNPENKPQINHKDGNKENNHVGNLEWVTPKENMRHAVLSGIKDSKINADNVQEIRVLYKSGKYTQKEIGELYELDQSHISRILSKERWGY